MEYIVINEQKNLDLYCLEIGKSPYIAIDTEFLRTTTYFPNLCLMQICYKKGFALIIDCLSNLDLSSLFKIIYNPNILKIFHGARQDLEIFFYQNRTLPPNLFDTQIAALALNYPKEISYEKLVKVLLDLNIDKSLKNSNWLKRPLSLNQLKYAAHDVIYLYEIYEKLSNILIQMHRLSWLDSHFKQMENPEQYHFNLEKKLFKALPANASAKEIKIIEALILWREQVAKNLNLSPNLVMTTHLIKTIALGNFNSKEALLEKLKEDDLEHYFDEIFTTVTGVAEIKEENLPIPKLTKNQVDIFHILKIILNTCANNYTVNSNLITTNEELTKFLLLKEESNASFLKGWSYDIFGRYALDFINGKNKLFIKDNLIYIQ
ncbi:Ribonuclease D [Candidatus Hepatincolaceae symbiont of Richtersius coronifer]